MKLVELPAFRAARARLDVPFTVLRVPVVSLNGAATPARCIGRATEVTIGDASHEAA